MIKFLEFIDRSTDAQFAAQLADRLDVEGFAQYLAFHNLVVDPDSLAGTGNNYYFLYSPRGRIMSIASWDQNLAFGRIGFVQATYRPYYEDGSGIPSGLQNVPELKELIPGAGIGEENRLVARFLATPKFRKLYDRTYRQLFRQLLASGRADALLDRLGDVIRAANDERALIDPTKFEADLARNHAFLAKRVEFLETVAPSGTPTS
jgi:spore coat protein CotH